MPDFSSEHIAEARANYDRYQRLLSDDRDIDWALIVLFYSALHLIQAHAERYVPGLKGEFIPQDHEQRNEYVARQLGEIYEDYMLLQNKSIDARYRMTRRSRQEVEDIHDSYFEPIRKHLAKRGMAW